MKSNAEMSEVVTYESIDHVAVITINRADKMNALNEETIVALQAAWRRLEASDDRVAVPCSRRPRL